MKGGVVRAVFVSIVIATAMTFVFGQTDVKVCQFEDDSCAVETWCDSFPADTCVEADPAVESDGAKFLVTCAGGDPVINFYYSGVCSGTPLVVSMRDRRCQRVGNVTFNMDCTINCFSGASVINLHDGSVKLASEVLEGDFVESFDVNGQPTFSEVFLVQHKGDNTLNNLRRIEYRIYKTGAVGAITLSDLHLIRKAKSADYFVAAKDVTIGSSIFVLFPGEIQPSEARVISIESIRSTVRNIHTMNDRIVVDGVMASSFTQIAPYSVLRVALLPMKLLHRMGFKTVVARIDTIVHHLSHFHSTLFHIK